MASTNRRLSAALPLKSQFEQAVLAAVELALEAGAPTTHILNLPHRLDSTRRIRGARHHRLSQLD
jgi:hypothetical protein